MNKNSYYHTNRFNNPRRLSRKRMDPSLFVNKAVGAYAQTAYSSVHQFSDFLISDQLKRNIAQKGYATPTPIQDRVIPLVLQGRDVVGIANTGTGKTGAFLIPLINKVLFNRSEKVLLVVPTRELAVQIEEEFKIFAKDMGILSALCIGGASIYNQIHSLKRNPNFVIGTPGRIKDLKKQGKLNIVFFNNIVLDEVDRMMDMGFLPDMRFIISHLPGKRQSLFFSATIPKQVIPLMEEFLNNPTHISVKTNDTAQSIEQDVVKINGQSKIDVLHDLLAQEDFKKVIVFGKTKWGIEKLSRALMQRRFSVVAIHGNKNQNQRQRALTDFKNGQVQVLLATDVAARGLDIDDVTHVINYDPPQSYDDYVHRIGRTGRADKKGIALTFIE